MKVLQFTIPVSYDKSVITDQVELPYHYPYLHRHKEAQITWVQQGEGTLIAGNNMHTYTAGEIYFLGANLPHLFKSNPEYFKAGHPLGVKALTIFFNPSGTLSPLLKTLKLFMQQHEQGFKIPGEYFGRISQAMCTVQNAAGPDKLIHFIRLLNDLNAIPVKPKALSGYGSVPGITENEGIRIGNIYNFIMQHYFEPVTLEDVAKAACMTPESLCRYFKKHTGNTLISFLNEVRINEACKKLTTHKFESISAIAYNCGFKSITNFNRVFKSVSGTSPREYLDNYRSNVNSLI
jgi:AraC-like DNA-binding protein